jgi:hypothetical protein
LERRIHDYDAGRTQAIPQRAVKLTVPIDRLDIGSRHLGRNTGGATQLKATAREQQTGGNDC